LRGACSAPLAQLQPGQRDDLLRQAARARFERKAGELENRARQAGWEQALWEGVFRALGYKQNVWAMQRVAELLRWDFTHKFSVLLKICLKRPKNRRGFANVVKLRTKGGRMDWDRTAEFPKHIA
jgi:hypothetical protein